ncbi:MAG TPA: ABC transporter permease [Candidatus Methylomirabilis sp.]|nr:ABC transporter permease [Candidatus Methylomirabilis sp.]
MAGDLAARPPAPAGRLGGPWLLLAPAIVFLALVYAAPLGQVLVLSVTDPAVSLAHYRRVFTTPLYLTVLATTFRTSLVVTLACLALGYPLAYAMARRPGRLAVALLAVVGMSFWTSFLVRTYAWMVILGAKGPVAALAHALGLGRPPQLLFTTFSSTLGMTHILLPYMVMALYAVMKKIDPGHLRAAASLGARPLQGFRHVFLPLSLPGVVNGCLLVFTLCLGFYVTPALIGSPRDMMISQLIAQQVDELLAWGFASALSVVLLAATFAAIAVYTRVAGLDRLWG